MESDSVGPSPMVTEVGRYAQSSRPDGQLSQHLGSAKKHPPGRFVGLTSISIHLLIVHFTC